MEKYNLGLCSVSFRNNSPEEIVKASVDAGLSYIEWGSDIHAPCNNPNALNKIVDLQNEYGISCSSYGTYFYIMRDSADELKEYIEAAKKLGTNILRLWCGEKGSADYANDEKEVFFAECKKLAEIAKNEGVILCMECHSGTFCDTAKSSAELMEAVNSPNFRMYWQPYVKVSDEENIESAKLLSRYTVNIHVFYWLSMKPRPLSEGKEAWEKYLLEFSKDKTLLLEFMPDGKIDSLPIETETLKLICK